MKGRMLPRRGLYFVLFAVGLVIVWKILSRQKPEGLSASLEKNCIGNVCESVGQVSDQGLVAGVKSFYFNGKPIRILSGSFHYFRTHPKQWRDRLEKMKSAGLNTVSTYIPWNLHEKTRGVYEFNGFFNLPKFIELVQDVKLHLIIRPGPYICAEWEFGGFPSWLLQDPMMAVRTAKYKPYLDAVELYFNQLLPILAKYTYKNGGPIVAFQIENEYGSYGSELEYMQFIKSLYERHALHELYFTSDGFEHLKEGSIPGVLETVNFNKKQKEALTALLEFQPHKPLMVGEFWPGWFDHWGEIHHTMPVDEFTQKVDEVLSMNASINFYMFVGGTNFGFWNGANSGESSNLVTVTSYDYDALVSEDGDIHPTKYKALRNLLIKHKLISTPLPPIPANSPKIAFEKVPIKEMLDFDEVIKSVPYKPTVAPYPSFMEFLNLNGKGGQGYGWILYRSSFKSGRTLKLHVQLQDRALIFLNRKLVKVIRSKREVTLDVTVELGAVENQDNVLNILVENMGRVNFQSLNKSRCGFQGKVELDGNLLAPWEMILLDFSDDMVAKIRKSEAWKSYNAQTYPTIYRGLLIANDIEDTFLDMRLWTKGIVIVNGFNIGRYWNIGPQQTLYIPKPLLVEGSNEIIVFELEKPADALNFVSEPILNDTRSIKNALEYQ